MRLWVEISFSNSASVHCTSASSWGCELKCNLNNIQKMNGRVSLFVRLWVEICIRDPDPKLYIRQPLREAVSWNTGVFARWKYKRCQPLREAVSWNNKLSSIGSGLSCQPLREAVSWNVDMIFYIADHIRQPLREAVSWNLILEWTIEPMREVSLFVRLWVEIYLKSVTALLSSSASSWGCELKYLYF